MDCKQCGQKIPGYDKRQIYCCKACYSASRKKTRKPKHCKQCGDIFPIDRFNYRNVFCSEACFHKNNTRNKSEKTCPECLNSFYVRPSESHRIHCSRECMYKKVMRYNREVRENPKWKDHPSYKDGRFCYREMAFEKFPNECKRCKKTGCKFEVHHIDENRHNNSFDNLEILCLSCHKKHHKSKLSGHLI